MSKKKKEPKKTATDSKPLPFAWILGGIVALGVVAYLVFVVMAPPVQAGELDSFAQCLSDKGAKFYGAYWCPHCENQKKLFGASADKLPYVECSLPGGQGQTAECRQAGIDSYPTWQFPDGSRQSGEIPLATLAQKTGCSLTPQ